MWSYVVTITCVPYKIVSLCEAPARSSTRCWAQTVLSDAHGCCQSKLSLYNTGMNQPLASLLRAGWGAAERYQCPFCTGLRRCSCRSTLTTTRGLVCCCLWVCKCLLFCCSDEKSAEMQVSNIVEAILVLFIWGFLKSKPVDKFLFPGCIRDKSADVSLVQKSLKSSLHLLKVMFVTSFLVCN